MLLNALAFTAGGRCTLTLDPSPGCLHAAWSGYITPSDAMGGAEHYLTQAKLFHSPYLLNDNSNLRGPWFDSLVWLERSWLPRARQLGLRYVAHVVQADARADILTLTCPVPTTNALELQLFDDVASARDWLRRCQPPRATHLQPRHAWRKPL